MAHQSVYVLWGEWHEDAVYDIFGVFTTPEAAWGQLLDYTLSPDNYYIDEDLESLCHAILEMYQVQLETLREASAFISKLKQSDYAALVAEFLSGTDDIYLHLVEKKIGELEVINRGWNQL